MILIHSDFSLRFLHKSILLLYFTTTMPKRHNNLAEPYDDDEKDCYPIPKRMNMSTDYEEHVVEFYQSVNF